mgnify:FL=1
MTHPWDTKWQITGNLATGGQGVTKKVSQLENANLTGVLKYLKNNKNLQARARMTREVNNLSLLPSLGGLVPNVLDHNTYEFENISSELFVTHGPLSIDDSIKIVMSICQTVAVAHEADILHRDIKPDNLILKNESLDDVFIIDYGLSFNLDNEDITQTDETFRNKFLDLPETNTPTGDHRDPRSDLTAVCAIFYFCLTGNKVGHLQDSNGTPAHLRPGYSVRDRQSNDNRIEAVEDYFTTGFTVNLSNRFQTISELINSLNAILTYDYSDVFQLAKRQSRVLLGSNPQIKVEANRAKFNELFQHIDNEFFSYHGELEVFDLARVQPTTRIGLKIEDRNPVHRNGTYHRISVAGLERSIIRQYILDYHESQWSLHAAEALLPDGKLSSVKCFDSVIEIASYEDDPHTIYNIVSKNIKDWIKLTILELSK